jgi:hypothetical protein
MRPAGGEFGEDGQGKHASTAATSSSGEIGLRK